MPFGHNLLALRAGVRGHAFEPPGQLTLPLTQGSRSLLQLFCREGAKLVSNFITGEADVTAVFGRVRQRG